MITRTKTMYSNTIVITLLGIVKNLDFVLGIADCKNNCTSMWECQTVSGYPQQQDPLGAKHFLLEPSYAYIWTSLNFSVNGRIKRVSFYASSEGEVEVAIWRSLNKSFIKEITVPYDGQSERKAEMEIVGKFTLLCDTECWSNGSNTRTLDESDRIWVSQGDYFGTLPSKFIYRHILDSTSEKKIWEYQDDLPGETVLTADDDIPEEHALPYGRAISVTYANTPLGSKHQFLFKAKTADESEFAQPSVSVTVECKCPANCDGECDMLTGECKRCNGGWSGAQCQKKCLPHKWGKGCKKTCSINCRNRLCDSVYGVCSEGCHSGFSGKMCMEDCTNYVEPGYYLIDGLKGSQTKCGYCLDMKPCQCDSGICVNGCAAGYRPPNCKELCDPGFFGENCQITCGNCDEPKNCRPTDGHCTNGCQEGWIGNFCTVSDKCKEDEDSEDVEK